MTDSAIATNANHSSTSPQYDIEQTVLERYREGAQLPQASLCCPTDYDASLLAVVPQEIIDKDYGCGDPTRYVQAGENVLDLGSGAGKNCYMLAQKVGATGSVIGVDFNDDMLALARRYQDSVAEQLGYHNTRFVKGKIQDLSLDLAQVEAYLQAHPVTSLESWQAFEAARDRQRQTAPLIPDNSIDGVVSNCVLNLVKPQDKQSLFQEIHRVLRPGGRAIISDIVCDRPPTENILNDPDLWSGCIAGAFQEQAFLQMFENAGFYGIELLKREAQPWQVVDGIPFRSVTVRAYKGAATTTSDRAHTVLYRGPWKRVEDDAGNVYGRGDRITVDRATYHRLTTATSPYAADLIALEADSSAAEASGTAPSSCCGPIPEAKQAGC